MNKSKLFKINRIICNSKFSKKYVDGEYGFGQKSLVVYPPVDVKNLKPGKKEKIILSVGRLGERLNNKKQEVLIEAFKKNHRRGLKGWKLILVGGVKEGGCIVAEGTPDEIAVVEAIYAGYFLQASLKV